MGWSGLSSFPHICSIASSLLRKNVFRINSLSSAPIFLSSRLLFQRVRRTLHQFLVFLTLRKKVAFKVIRFIRNKKPLDLINNQKSVKGSQGLTKLLTGIKKLQLKENDENCNFGNALSNDQWPTGSDKISQAKLLSACMYGTFWIQKGYKLRYRSVTKLGRKVYL